MNAGICAHTRTRHQACSCGACARGKAPSAKHRANQRDVLALFDLIAGCVENQRERLMEIAIGFALGPDGDEQAARGRIEEARCAEDEHVGEALIDAM